jgi:hypothetical protein
MNLQGIRLESQTWKGRVKAHGATAGGKLQRLFLKDGKIDFFW